MSNCCASFAFDVKCMFVMQGVLSIQVLRLRGPDIVAPATRAFAGELTAVADASDYGRLIAVVDVTRVAAAA